MANGLAPLAPGARICALALVALQQGEPITQAWCIAAAIRKWGDRGVREAEELSVLGPPILVANPRGPP
eukprot:12303514-Alexandrium_andersonii.AAC.1